MKNLMNALKIKKGEFAGKYTESQAQALLHPIEKEIDRMVEELYGYK